MIWSESCYRVKSYPVELLVADFTHLPSSSNSRIGWVGQEWVNGTREIHEQNVESALRAEVSKYK